MKRILVYAMILMMLFALVGCGSGSEKTTETGKNSEGTTQVLNEENAIYNGYWVVEKMVLDGAEFEGEDLEGIFGPASAVLSIGFTEAGNLNGVYFEDFFDGSYTGGSGQYKINMLEEEITAVLSDDGKLEMKFKDGSQFVLVNQTDMPEALAKNPWVTYKLEFTKDETIAMSNFMAGGRYLVKDNVVYGLTHAKSNAGSLGATPFTMKGDFPEFEETKILDERGAALYLTLYEDYLYYILNNEQICRVHLDGSGLEVLYEGSCDYFQIHEGRLYFADAEYHFVSTDLEGKNLSKVVEKEIYYPYFICSDWMVFQDDADDESLHLYNVTHGTELNITYIPSHCPIMDANYLYYTDVVDDQRTLVRIDMSDPQTFRAESSEKTLLEGAFMIDDTSIYTTNNMSRDKEEWKELSDTREAITARQIYVSQDYTINFEYDEEGYISRKSLFSKERFGGSSFK